MYVVANNLNLILGVWLCYTTLWHEHNDKKRRQNNEKTAAILVLSYCYLVPVGKVVFQAHRDRCCSFVMSVFLMF